MADKLKLLNVTFNVPPGYQKTSDKRVILIESENGDVSEVDLDANGREPTFKLAGGDTLSKGSNNRVTVDKTTKSISTVEKYSNGSYEITFLVRRYIASRDICRSLKKEVEKYSDVTYDYSFDGYRANLGNENYALHCVSNRCLVVVTTNDLINAPTVINNRKMNTGALIRLIAGVLVILFALYALIRLGLDGRILILVAMAIILISTGYDQLNQKDIECPKLKI